jgi:hypothetical protein
MMLAIVALAVAGDVGILPVAGDGSIDERHRAQVAESIKSVLKNRAVSLTMACDASDGRCLEKAVGSNKDIDEVAAAWLGKNKDGRTHLTLTVLSVPDWKVALSVERNIDPGQEPDAVEELCVHAFDPGRWTGRVTIDGIPKGTAFMVDGLPATDTHLTLTVGDHELEVPRDDGPPVTTSFHVDWQVDKLVVASPSTSSGGAQRVGLGPVPPTIVAAAGLAAAVTALVVDLAVLQPAINSWNQRAIDPLEFLDKNADPTSNGWGAAGYAGDGGNGLPSEPARITMVAVSLQNQRKVANTDVVMQALVGAGAATLVGAGACAAIALWVVPE